MATFNGFMTVGTGLNDVSFGTNLDHDRVNHTSAVAGRIPSDMGSGGYVSTAIDLHVCVLRALGTPLHTKSDSIPE